MDNLEENQERTLWAIQYVPTGQLIPSALIRKQTKGGKQHYWKEQARTHRTVWDYENHEYNQWTKGMAKVEPMVHDSMESAKNFLAQYLRGPLCRSEKAFTGNTPRIGYGLTATKYHKNMAVGTLANEKHFDPAGKQLNTFVDHTPLEQWPTQRTPRNYKIVPVKLRWEVIQND